MRITRHLSRTQRVALPGQERNYAGGFAYRLEPRQQLDRFLILGTEGGTYYVSDAEYVTQLRGWGRGLRRAIGSWYQTHDLRELAYQVTKYRQRYGWSHRDLLRLTHPKADTPARNALFRYIVTRAVAPELPAEVGAYLEAVERLNQPDLPQAEVVRLIRDYALPREVVPTHLLTYPAVWEALLQEMPMTAMIRNLATMTRVGPLQMEACACHPQRAEQGVLSHL